MRPLRPLLGAVFEPSADPARFDSAHVGGAAEGGWDYRLGCPWVVPMADRSLRPHYIGSNQVVGPGPSTELTVVHQIGLAVSDGDITRWRRWEDPR